VTGSRIARLADFAEVLRNSGYTIEYGELAGVKVLLGETPYALVACMEAESWDDLARRVSDVQAALTQLASQAPSPRRWDLYLVVHVLVRAASAAEEATADELEADTHYVRKFVRTAVDLERDGSLDRALRPLLPLRTTPEFDVTEPLDVLRQELHDLRLPDDVADAAIDAFRRGKEITVP
jgi:hypothetical protein